MNKIKGCIFDLDGVIVDTAKYHFLAWKKLAQELGVNFSEKDNLRLKGVSRFEALEILLSIGNINIDEKTKFKLAEKKNKWYLDFISHIDKSEIFTGVEDFINVLRGKKIKIALGSSSKNVTTILEKTEISNLFDAVIDGNKISNSKPNPEIFLLCARELNTKPETCVVFEDSEAGLIAAKSAGMYAIGVGLTHEFRNADMIIQNFNDVSIHELIMFNNKK